MAELTDWQQTAVDNLIELAKRHGLVVDRHQLSIMYMPETRPGRGHDIQVAWISPDYVIADFIDVYGRSNPSIGEVAWIHTEDDDGAHECETCTPDHSERIPSARAQAAIERESQE